MELGMLLIINQAKEHIIAKEVILNKDFHLVKEIIISLTNNMDNTYLAKDSI
jgi:hypothetical protein